jgi:hypothetical protein
MSDSLTAYVIAAGCFVGWGIICGIVRSRRVGSKVVVGSYEGNKLKYSS